MQIAFVTYDKLPALTDDDKMLAEYLLQKNISVNAVLWDDATINWQHFDAVILRSMWDYFKRPEEFNQWLDKLERLECKVLNPLPVVRWNQNKNYFDDLSKQGVLLPSYIICCENNNKSLKEILNDNGWNKAVVKPTISGGAYNTWVTDCSNTDEMRFSELLKTGDVIVQQFVEEIITKGELSLVFFNKKFSHAVCKKAKPGDFRVQEQFGGTAEIIQPNDTILHYASNILHNINERLLYARVDGVLTTDGKFLLMELELIEPSLFITGNDKACENFYKAFEEIVSVKNSNFKMKKIQAINISEKFSLFEKLWTPHIIGELNGQYVKLCKLKDDFVWHNHENEDELFMVFKGTLNMEFRDGRTVEVKEGEILIVPKGVEHRPYTKGEIVFNLLFEPKETLHTGKVDSGMTVKEIGWI